MDAGIGAGNFMGWFGEVSASAGDDGCVLAATEGGIKKGNEPLVLGQQALLLLGTFSYRIPQNRRYV